MTSFGFLMYGNVCPSCGGYDGDHDDDCDQD